MWGGNILLLKGGGFNSRPVMGEFNTTIEALFAEPLEHVMKTLTEVVGFAIALLGNGGDDDGDEWSNIFRCFTHSPLHTTRMP